MGKVSSLGCYLKELRKSFDPTVPLYDVAKGVGVTESFLHRVENGNKCLSPEMAHKIAVFYQKGRLAQQKIFFELLKRIILYQHPEAQMLLNGGEAPNIYFIKRLMRDMEKTGTTVPELAERADISCDQLNYNLAGEGTISREQIFILALALEQRPIEYLLLSGYLPYETMNILTQSEVLLKGLAIATEMHEGKENGEE